MSLYLGNERVPNTKTGNKGINNPISYDPQSPTMSEQAQAKKNIGVDKDLDGKADKYLFKEMTETTVTLEPNTLYKWGEVTSLTLTLGAEEPGVANEYLFEFVSGNTPTTLDIPASIKWFTMPVIEANKTYQVSILNGIGVMAGA